MLGKEPISGGQKEGKTATKAEAAPVINKKNAISLYNAVNAYDLNVDAPNVEGVFKQNRLTTLQKNSYISSMFTAMGSTFFTNNANRVKSSLDSKGFPIPTHTMDASYCAVLPNGGTVLAIADGCGGHSYDDLQDKAIGYLSHTASKCAAQVLTRYTSHRELSVDIAEGKVIPEIEKNIREKFHKKSNGLFQRYNETTTLACARTYKEEDGCVRVVGFSIGDGMIVSWSPKTKTFLTLAYSRSQVLDDRGQEGTASVPSSYAPDEVQSFSRVIPPGSIVLALTDFVTLHLPCDTETIKTPKSKFKEHRATVLKESAMVELLGSASPNATSAEIGQLIIDAAFEVANRQFTELKNRSKVIKEQIPALEQELTRIMSLEDGRTSSEKQASPEFKQAIFNLDKIRNDAYIQHGDDVGLVAVYSDEKRLKM